MIQKLHTRRGGFTLVEIMIVVAIIALLAAIAVPNFMRARKRSQATRMLQDLRLLNDAVDQYAIDNSKPSGSGYSFQDLKVGTQLYAACTVSPGNPGGNPLDMFGNTYRSVTGEVDVESPGCEDISINPNTFAVLSDVAPSTFWSPFGIAPTP